MTGTYWFGKKDMLMIGFIAEAKKRELVLSGEVDEAVWVPVSQALKRCIRPEAYPIRWWNII